jgi:antitoxin YefM
MNANGRPVVITQNGRPAAVVLTPEDFEELGYREFVKAKVKAGLKSAAEGAAVSPAEARKRVKARIAASGREG